MADYKRVICKDCGEDKLHWAKGQCHRCYMKKYRKDHGVDGIAKIKTDAQECVIEAVAGLLVHWGGTCRLRGNEVSIELNDDTKRAKL